MTDLERVLEYARADGGRYYPLVKEAIDAHLKEDAERERHRCRCAWSCEGVPFEKRGEAHQRTCRP